MERKISLSDLRKAVDDAYEAVKSVKEGETDPRNVNADTDEFGIAVVLADGTVITKADADAKVPMGALARIPLFSVLLTQNSVMDLVKKSGQCEPHAHSHADIHPHVGICAHAVRAFSAVEPTGDPESKWNIFEGRTIDLMGSAPELDVAVYKKLKDEVDDKHAVDGLAKAGYYLYDNAEMSVDLYAKAQAMKASARQLAMMGATIAADGVNPATGKIVYDGAISQNIVGMMAAKGPHHMNFPWSVAAGLPAMSSFGGAMLGIYPGVMAIAATSANVNFAGISVKAARAIMHIMRSLDLSVYASAKIEIVKD